MSHDTWEPKATYRVDFNPDAELPYTVKYFFNGCVVTSSEQELRPWMQTAVGLAATAGDYIHVDLQQGTIVKYGSTYWLQGKENNDEHNSYSIVWNPWRTT